MIQNIGNIRYDYNVSIKTSGSVNANAIALNADAVNLSIVDNVFQPFVSSTMVFTDASKSIQPSGNGDDEIIIDITQLDDAQKFGSSSNAGTAYKKIKGKFFAYKTKAVNDSVSMVLTHALESEMYNAADVNSSDVAGATESTLLSDDERAAYTGDLIKAILTQNLGAQYIGSNFNQGNRKKFYYTTANERAINAILYLRNIHTCSQNVPCILSHSTYTDKISFISLADYFKNHQNYLMGESFVYSAKSAGSLDSAKATKLPAGAGPILANFSEIQGEPSITPFTDAWKYLSNSKTMVTDRSNKTQSNFAVGTSSKVEEFNKIFVDPFKKIYNAVAAFTSSVDNDVGNAYSRPTFTAESSNFNATQEGNAMIKNLLFGGNIIRFNVVGAPWRRSATFIDITAQGISSPEYNKKIAGRWFVTHVEHKFDRSKGYTNYLECVRPYNVA
jgi:hypothetical protein